MNRQPVPNPVFDRLRRSVAGAAAGEGAHERLTVRDGTRIFIRSWTPESPKRIVVCFHGATGHGEYFAVVADILAPRGAAVFVADYRGHGLSGGPRGDFPSFATLLEDCREVVAAAKAKHPELPVVILGESMGGCVAANYAAKYPGDASAMILLAPALKFRGGLPLSPQLLLLPYYLLVYAFSPGCPVINTAGREEQGIRNPLHIEYDKTDPLHISRISPRYFLELNRNMAAALRDGPARIEIPTLLMQGEADAAIDPAGAREFMARLAAADKELAIYPDGFHALLTDAETGSIAKLADWVDKH